MTPCHNYGKFVHRLLDTTLEQTWDNVEFIFVDNASTDNTPVIAKEYKAKFEKKGYQFKYILNDDVGPSAGINRGLKDVEGDYLIMVDSDDYFTGDDSIEILVNVFENLNDSYGMIKFQVQLIQEEGMIPIGIADVRDYGDDKRKYFEDCLFERNEYFYSGIGYIVKVEYLRKLTDMEIFSSYYFGQNKQIPLPLHYTFNTFALKKVLGCYLVRHNSLSHGGGDYGKFETHEAIYDAFPAYIDSIFATIPSMPVDEKERYRREFLKMQTKKMYFSALAQGRTEKIKKYLGILNNNYGGRTFIDRLRSIKIRIKRLLRG